MSFGYFTPLSKNEPFSLLENGSFFDRLKSAGSGELPALLCGFQNVTVSGGAVKELKVATASWK